MAAAVSSVCYPPPSLLVWRKQAVVAEVKPLVLSHLDDLFGCTRAHMQDHAVMCPILISPLILSFSDFGFFSLFLKTKTKK